MSAERSVRSAATVESRSSQRMTGSEKRSSSRRARSWHAFPRGPTDPSMLRGSPTTMAPTPFSSISSSRRCIQSGRVRSITPAPWAVQPKWSLTATPVRFFPTSNPMIREGGEKGSDRSRLFEHILVCILSLVRLQIKSYQFLHQLVPLHLADHRPGVVVPGNVGGIPRQQIPDDLIDRVVSLLLQGFINEHEHLLGRHFLFLSAEVEFHRLVHGSLNLAFVLVTA